MLNVVNNKMVLGFMLKVMNLVLIMVPMLLAIALLTLLERKTLGYMQLRKGPKLVGPLGLLQPFADGMKLFMKEKFKPSKSTPMFFILSPPVFFFMAILLWQVAPLQNSAMKFSLSLLFMITFSSLSVYSILGAGWASKSKYALLGALRAVAQTMSYEVSFGLILLPLVMLMGGWGIGLFVKIQCMGIVLILPCLPLFVTWFMSSLAETKRTPFDLAEGESELVSGYKVEYAGAPFALFFLGEYAKIMFIKLITVTMFFKLAMFSVTVIKTVLVASGTLFFVFMFLWMRASFPRMRYDQLMTLMWKAFLPMSMAMMKVVMLFMMLAKVMPPHY